MVTIRSAAPTDAHLLWDAERQTAMTPGLLAARPGEILVDAFKAKIEALTSRGRYAVAELEGAPVGTPTRDRGVGAPSKSTKYRRLG
jgi:hypothetical protein